MAKRSKVSIIEKHLLHGFTLSKRNLDSEASFKIFNPLGNFSFEIPFDIKKEHIQTYVQQSI